MNLKLWLKSLFFRKRKPKQKKAKKSTALEVVELETRVVPTSFMSISSGNWQNAATWSGGVSGHTYPIAGDTVDLTGGYTVTVPSGESDALATLIVGDSGGSGSLVFAASSSALNVSGDVTVGYNSLNTGTVDMSSGGTLDIGGAFTLTSSASTFTAGSGTVEFDGTSQNLPAATFHNLTINEVSATTATLSTTTPNRKFSWRSGHAR